MDHPMTPTPKAGALDVRFSLQLGTLNVQAAVTSEPGETIAIVGPNGAGKSTVLRAIAGLIGIDAGHIRMDGTPFDEPTTTTWVHPENRPVSVVFQDHRLFPHLSAQDNVAFALRANGLGRKAARVEALTLLEQARLTSAHASRRPSELSGGQAQRVALARAFATGADALLLDEPLAAIDKASQVELRRVIGELASTVLLVTHNPLDARLLADSIVVMDEGAVVQSGAADDVSNAPSGAWAAEFLGQNLIEGTADGTCVTTLNGFEFTTATPDAGPVVVNFAPSAITLSSELPGGSARNAWPTSVTQLVAEADRVRVQLGDPLPCWATVTVGSVKRLGLEVGSPVTASLKATELRVSPR